MTDRILQHISGLYSPEEYPALGFQLAEWNKLRPLCGLTVVDATPVFNNTLVKYLPLLAGGARLMVGVGELTPFDPEVLEHLRDWGVPAVSPGEVAEADVVLDCAGVFSQVPSRFGYVELTRSGLYRYRGTAAPVFFADAGRIKFIETSLGTGEGYLRAMRSLDFDFSGRHVLVFGGGKVGRGIAAYARHAGAAVAIADPASPVMPPGVTSINTADERAVTEAVNSSDYIVSATGVSGALSRYAAILKVSRAVIANMGVEDEFGPDVPTARVLNDKHPLNFMLPEPTRLRYIDPTMALANAGVLELTRGGVASGIHAPSAELETEILSVVRRDGVINEELDMLEMV